MPRGILLTFTFDFAQTLAPCSEFLNFICADISCLTEYAEIVAMVIAKIKITKSGKMS